VCGGRDKRRLQRPHDYVYPGKVNVWSRAQCFQTAVIECRNQVQESGDLGVPRLKPASGSAAFASEVRCWAQMDVLYLSYWMMFKRMLMGANGSVVEY
jgi:hypothetical protein